MKINLCQILLKQTSIILHIGYGYGTTEKLVASKFSGMQMSYSLELKNKHWVHYFHTAAYFAMKAVTPLMTTGIFKLVSFTHIHLIVSYL